MKLLIDGYNLFKNIVRKSDLTPQEKDSLLQKLVAYAEKKQLLTYVVFDGGDLPNPYVERMQMTTIYYAGSYKKADPLIVDLMDELSGEIVLISSDRELVQKAIARSIEALSPVDFAPLFIKPLKSTSVLKKRLHGMPSKFPDSSPSAMDELMKQSLNQIVEKYEEDEISSHLQSTNKKTSLLLKRLSL